MIHFKEEIEMELEKVNERISSKEKLLLTYPNDTGLTLSLESFKNIRNKLLFLLEQFNEKTLYQRLDDVKNYFRE